MNTCVIFCAGGFEKLAQPLDSTDYILAADGGLTHIEKLGLTPNGIIGDFDSLGYVPQGAQVFPVEKDDTDSMLAVRKGLELGYRRFVLYGALDGPRLDHTLANLQTLCFLADHSAQGYLAGLRHMATCIKNGVLIFPASAKGILSLFCMGPDARQVTLHGLQYNLENGTLTSGFPLGVSNHFTGREAAVTVGSGTLLAIYDIENGFPTGG
ncbi:MAG: thiamine diphosphokinase [Oscillospiraceae bacterium]|nr:thiamine diphosphokinase [Oscillospiraceae bacterium]